MANGQFLAYSKEQNKLNYVPLEDFILHLSPTCALALITSSGSEAYFSIFQ